MASQKIGGNKRGRPFKKGEGGRPKGVPNKTTIAAKEAFNLAFEKLGGVDRLVRWANQYPTEFFKLYGRLIPMDVTTNGEKLTVTINVPPLPDGGPDA